MAQKQSHRLFFYKNITAIFITFFLLLFSFQIIFQIKTEYIKPNIYVVPPLPNKYMINALSLGDKEFYFRVLALKIQNAGDTFGRNTPLKNYDYKELYQWFTLLDSLNSEARIIPSLASYYYAQTQNKEDTIYIVNYLNERASKNVDKNWWWLFQAIYIARSVLSDNNLALELAEKLSTNNAKDAPLWTKQMPAFIYSKMGKHCDAFLVITKILQENESGKRVIKADEMDFMRHFIKQSIQDMKNDNFDPRKCTTKN